MDLYLFNLMFYFFIMYYVLGFVYVCLFIYRTMRYNRALQNISEIPKMAFKLDFYKCTLYWKFI